MNDDLRNRFKRSYANEPTRQRYARPRPAKPEVLRPVSEHKPVEPVAHPVQSAPAAQQQSAPVQEAAVPETKTAKKARSGRNKMFVGVGFLVILLAVGGFAYAKNNGNSKAANDANSTGNGTVQKSQTTGSQQPQAAASITPAPTVSTVTQHLTKPPVYPTGLPTTFHSNSDTQLIGTNTVYYTYSDDKGNQYYVTQQPTPANFNYNGFKGNLGSAEEFNVPIGSAVVGASGSELLGGIRTTSGLWIIVGASSTSLRPQLKELMNALQPLNT